MRWRSSARRKACAKGEPRAIARSRREARSRKTDRASSTADTVPYEENRLPLVRPLVAVAAIADAIGLGHPAAIDRIGGRRGAAWRGRRLFPGPSLRPP